MYQSTAHGARPTRNPRPPGGDHPAAAQRACPRIRAFGAGRAAARGCCIIQDDSGSEEERAAGGPRAWRLEPPMLTGRGAPSACSQGWRRRCRDKGTCSDGHGWGPQAEPHGPTAAVRPELGLGWQESARRWTGTRRCRAAPTAPIPPNGVRGGAPCV